MIVHKWLEIAAAGMDLLALLMAGWYSATKYRDQVQDRADAQLLSLDSSPSTAPLLCRSSVNETGLLTRSLAAEDAETGAEEILGARLARRTEPFLDAVAGWWKKLSFMPRRLGWLKIGLLALSSLPLLALYLLLCVLLLPLIVTGYLFDLDRGLRLRIIVLAFTLGTTFQIIAALKG